MPALLERTDEFVSMRGKLAELAHDLREDGVSESGGLPEAKAFEARLDEILGWFEAEGIEVKGIAPLLVDFPSMLDGVSVQPCGLEGDRDLAGITATNSDSPAAGPFAERGRYSMTRSTGMLPRVALE